MQTCPRVSGSRKGQALVESALTILVFLAMLMATLDFGQFLYFQQSLVERTRAAARYAVLSPTQTAQIQNMALYNSTTSTNSSKPLLPGLTTNMVLVETFDLGATSARVKVTISGYPINFVTPGLAGNFSSISTSVTYPSEAP